jgi:hypothetical protein
MPIWVIGAGLKGIEADQARNAAACAQGLSGGVHWGVKMADLPGSGSRSAVFLIHPKHRQARGQAEQAYPGVHRSESGCYHMRSVNVL